MGIRDRYLKIKSVDYLSEVRNVCSCMDLVIATCIDCLRFKDVWSSVTLDTLF